MSFSLEHFELHFSSELLPPGEQLYETGAIIFYEEVERNLWTFEIKDVEQYEIEILISPSKVNNFSCDCGFYKAQKECKHIIAALYQLRLLKTKKIRKGPRVVKSFPKKLSIPNILNQIPPDDLKNFVRNYAKKNKHFSTTLKANFARKIELDDNEIKYENILNSIIKPATGASYRITHNTLKQFINVAHQFDAQFEDAISLKQNKEAFYILKSIMAKVAYVNHWLASQKDEVLELDQHFHRQFQIFSELDIPPSLRNELVSYGIDLAGRSYYHPTHPEYNLLAILSNLIDDEKQLKLNDILNAKLTLEIPHQKEMEYLWIIRQTYIQNGIDLKKADSPVLSSQAVYRVSDYLAEQKSYIGLKSFIDLFKVKGKIKDVFLVKRYVYVLVKLEEKEELIETCIESLIVHKDVYFYKVLTKNYPAERDGFFKDIHSKISDKRTLAFEKLYLEILRSDHMVEDLLDQIVHSKFANRHIYDFAHYIIENTNKLVDVTIQIIKNYLKEFLGRESAVEIRRLLVFFRQNEWFDEFRKVKDFVDKEFESRKALINEIKGLR